MVTLGPEFRPGESPPFEWGGSPLERSQISVKTNSVEPTFSFLRPRRRRHPVRPLRRTAQVVSEKGLTGPEVEPRTSTLPGESRGTDGRVQDRAYDPAEENLPPPPVVRGGWLRSCRGMILLDTPLFGPTLT